MQCINLFDVMLDGFESTYHRLQVHAVFPFGTATGGAVPQIMF
jgi:hypothetical protein